jgi:hypothetical protein
MVTIIIAYDENDMSSSMAEIVSMINYQRIPGPNNSCYTNLLLVYL